MGVSHKRNTGLAGSFVLLAGAINWRTWGRCCDKSHVRFAAELTLDGPLKK
jgi:hypothetical protein